MDFHSDSVDRLFETIHSLESVEECQRFFEDLCTIKEILDMAQRLDTAILLDKGMSYHTIAEQVGISTATISRVSRCLTYGAGGYRDVIERLKKKEQTEKEQEKEKDNADQ